jgi:hypothetical protein
MRMAVSVLHYFKLKPNFLPDGVPSLGIYVRPAELADHMNPDQWELVGPTFHPNELQAADVERQGYCLRPGFRSKRV